MNVLSNIDYENKKNAFLKSHDDWHVETSPMDSDGKYVKNYICENGDCLTEVNRPVYTTVKATIYDIEIDVDVKLFEHEMFSNRFPSFLTYEKY